MCWGFNASALRRALGLTPRKRAAEQLHRPRQPAFDRCKSRKGIDRPIAIVHGAVEGTSPEIRLFVLTRNRHLEPIVFAHQHLVSDARPQQVAQVNLPPEAVAHKP